MPIRSTRQRAQRSSVNRREIEQLRALIREGWPWRLHESAEFCTISADDRLQIALAHLTGVFTLSCGFNTDPHPSKQTVKFLRTELAADLKKAEKRWGHLVPKSDRWRSDDLRARPASWGGDREEY